MPSFLTPFYKDRLLEIYYKILSRIESDLYYQCVFNDIALENLFLVKSIGDEVWYVYELHEGGEEQDRINKALVNKIINILLDTVNKQDRMFVSEREILYEEEIKNKNLYNSIEHDDLILPRKCYIDLLNDFRSFTDERIDRIIPTLMEAFKNKGESDPKKAIQEKIHKISISLNLGIPEIMDNDKIKFNNIRFDPIGRDVDLFFRCSKFMIPSLLRMGDNLFNYIATKIDEKKFNIEYGNSHYTKIKGFNYIKSFVSKEDLKGIGNDYNIYTILNFCYTPPLAIRKDQLKKDGYQEAREHLLKNNFINSPMIDNDFYTYSINKNNWTTFGRK